jgi:Tfp pilus assembly protein PilF
LRGFFTEIHRRLQAWPGPPRTGAYTEIVARAILPLLLAWALAFGAQPPPKPEQQPSEPEEEDASLKPREYVFNPIQAANEVKIGLFYMKRKSYKAAAGRFEEALRWSPADVKACTLLGEAREKLRDKKGAKAAYEQCLTMSPDEKTAADLKERVRKLS